MDSTPDPNNTLPPPQDPDSITEVDLRIGGPRRTCSFKGNRKLWNAFVKHCKANYGSVCNMLEPFCLAVVTGSVNLSSTIKPLCIENFYVERVDLQRLRRVTSAPVKEEDTSPKICAVCGQSAAVRVNMSKDYRFLCQEHLDKERKASKWPAGWAGVKPLTRKEVSS